MILLVVALALAVAALIGWLWWRGDGTLRRGSGERIRPDEVALPEDAFGPAEVKPLTPGHGPCHQVESSEEGLEVG